MSDLGLLGLEEIEFDQSSVTREQMLEDALTGRGRAVAADAVVDAHSEFDLTIDRERDPHEAGGKGGKGGRSGGVGRGLRQAGCRGGSGGGSGAGPVGGRTASGVSAGRRAVSAPAAATRRVGPTRVATRRRTSMTMKRQTLERLANMRRETSGGGGGGGGGGGLFGGGKHGQCNSATARNQGPRNTMGMRCMQPRSSGLM